MEITLCGNTETMLDGADEAIRELPEHDHEHIAVQMFAQMVRIIEDADHTFRQDELFLDWHGGKRDQFGKRCGLLWCREKQLPEAVEALLWRADEAAQETRERLVAELVEENRQRQAELDAEEAELEAE